MFDWLKKILQHLGHGSNVSGYFGIGAGVPGMIGAIFGALATWALWFDTLPFAAKAILTLGVGLLAALASIWAMVGWQRWKKAKNSDILISEQLATSKEGADVKYTRGSTHEGASHRLSDIFGRQRMVSHLTFRNCIIDGPGVVCFTNAKFLDGTVLHSTTSSPQAIDVQMNKHLLKAVPEFYECKFENVTFTDVIFFVVDYKIVGIGIQVLKLLAPIDSPSHHAIEPSDTQSHLGTAGRTMP